MTRRLLAASLTATIFASPLQAQREGAGPFEVQVGILVPTRALGAADGYSVRLRSAPTIALAWHRSGSDRIHTRGVLEATPYLWGRVSPTSECTGHCQPTDFTILGASLGADLVLTPSGSASIPTYLALGARGRAYFLATAKCPTVPGAFCPGGDPLTEPAIRPGLALSAGAVPRSGARGLSIEVGYLPTWVRNGRVQHDFRAAFGSRF